MSISEDRINASLVQLEEDTRRLNRFSAGSEDEVVPTESGPIPSLAGLSKQWGEAIMGVTSEAVQAASEAKQSAGQSTQEAQRAGENSHRAVQAADRSEAAAVEAREEARRAVEAVGPVVEEFNQIKTDASALPVTADDEEESRALGAWMKSIKDMEQGIGELPNKVRALEQDVNGSDGLADQVGELKQFEAGLSDPDKGAAMVARGVVAVESFNALTLLPADQRRSDLRYLVCGSVFRWDAVKIMFVPEGPVTMGAFGAGRGGDDTAAFHQAAAYFRSLGYADIDFEDKSYYINAVYGMDLQDLAYFRTRGTGARITLERPTQEGMRTVFNLTRIPYVLAEGIRYTTRVLDNSTPISGDEAGSRSYLIRASNPNPDAPFGNPGHVFIARDNTFIDEVGLPNTTFRPFNGCIQAAGYGLVRIYDNEFINGAGRVCYVNDSTNVVVTRNKFKNLNYTPFPVSTPLGTLAVRVLSSKGVRIYDNDFEVADENNHTSLMTIVTLEGSSQYPSVMCEDVRIFENRIKAKNCDSIWGVRASFCRNLKVYGNTFNGKPDAAGTSRFFYIEPLTSETMAAYDIQVYENTIDPAYEGVIAQAVGATARSGEITVYGNHLKFHSAVVNDAILIPGEYGAVRDNKVYLDGELQGDVSGRNYYDPNTIGKRRVDIVNSNLANYVDSDGVLNLPKDVGIVSFNITSNVEITDITVGGAKPNMRSILLYNRQAAAGSAPIIKQHSSRIRLPGGVDHNLSVAPIRLMYPGLVVNFWVTV